MSLKCRAAMLTQRDSNTEYLFQDGEALAPTEAAKGNAKCPASTWGRVRTARSVGVPAFTGGARPQPVQLVTSDAHQGLKDHRREERFPQAGVKQEGAGPEVLAFTAFPVVALDARSGRTAPRSTSTRRCGGTPTSWASSRTGLRSGDSPGRSSPSSTTSGRSTPSGTGSARSQRAGIHSGSCTIRALHAPALRTRAATARAYRWP